MTERGGGLIYCQSKWGQGIATIKKFSASDLDFSKIHMVIDILYIVKASLHVGTSSYSLGAEYYKLPVCTVIAG